MTTLHDRDGHNAVIAVDVSRYCHVFNIHLWQGKECDGPLDAGEGLLDVLEQVGPSGEFLSQQHTLDTMRRLWMPHLFDRSEWSEWEAAGGPGPREAARERLLEILNGDRPGYLDPALDKEIRSILDRHESEEGGLGHG